MLFTIMLNALILCNVNIVSFIELSVVLLVGIMLSDVLNLLILSTVVTSVIC
jgi:hypothetical protein